MTMFGPEEPRMHEVNRRMRQLREGRRRRFKRFSAFLSLLPLPHYENRSTGFLLRSRGCLERVLEGVYARID